MISRDEIEFEEYAWDDDLPGTISMELHPNLWLGKSNDFKFQNINLTNNSFRIDIFLTIC